MGKCTHETFFHRSSEGEATRNMDHFLPFSFTLGNAEKSPEIFYLQTQAKSRIKRTERRFHWSWWEKPGQKKWGRKPLLHFKKVEMQALRVDWCWLAWFYTHLNTRIVARCNWTLKTSLSGLFLWTSQAETQARDSEIHSPHDKNVTVYAGCLSMNVWAWMHIR